MLNIAEDWEFLQRVDMAELGAALEEAGVIPEDQTVEEFLKPYDYEKVFAPLTKEELRKAIGEPAPVGSEDSLPSSNQKDEEGKSAPKRGISDLL